MAKRPAKENSERPMWAQTLKLLRRRAALTQGDLAKLLGITQQGYSLYEKGEREPTIDSWLKLRSEFGVSIDFLMGAEGSLPVPLNSSILPATGLVTPAQFETAMDELATVAAKVTARRRSSPEQDDPPSPPPATPSAVLKDLKKSPRRKFP